jgi:quercetin dioxygenase-like cupin family protein
MHKRPLIQSHPNLQPLQVLGTEVRFLCDAEHTNNAFSMMEVTLPQGSGPPPHHHDWDEAYYVADGLVQFQIDGTTREVGRGDFVYAPAGTVHGFSGLSELPARVIILDAPAYSAGFFREVNREIKVMPEDGAKVPGIGLKHGIHFLPPAD